MKRKLIPAIAGILLTLSALGLQADRAEAHNFDNVSLWVCSHPDVRPSSTWSVDHSYPSALYDGLVEETCYWHSTFTGAQYCAIGKYDVNTGAIYRDDPIHVAPCPYNPPHS